MAHNKNTQMSTLEIINRMIKYLSKFVQMILPTGNIRAAPITRTWIITKSSAWSIRQDIAYTRYCDKCNMKLSDACLSVIRKVSLRVSTASTNELIAPPRLPFCPASDHKRHFWKMIASLEDSHPAVSGDIVPTWIFTCNAIYFIQLKFDRVSSL